MATLREIQLAELEMLKLLDKICKENNLKYSMIGGTMLGAIRHKGFIPWDDDIDVYMPLEDVRKLQKIFHEEGYFLQTPETDIQMPFLMYKIRKNGTRMVEPGTEKLEIHQGVWLDIFPYVNAGNTEAKVRIQKFLRSILSTYRCRYRYCYKGNKRLIHYFFSKLSRKTQLSIDRFLEASIEYFGSSKANRYFAIDVSNHTIHLKKFFDNSALFEFEGRKFWGVKEFDEYLSSIYGSDYMTPREWNHIGDYSEVIL